MQADVYIDGVRLNIQDAAGLPFALSFAIADSENPGRVSGARSSRTVTFPSDSTNDAFFRYWQDAASADNTRANRLPARVEVNGLPVFQGVAQLKSAVLSAGPTAYNTRGWKVAFFGNNATWFSYMQALLIRDLGLLPEHDLDRDVVSANDNPTPGTDTWGYTLIRMIDWQDTSSARWSEMTPFIFIRDIVQKAFAGSGYTVQSDFFDTDFFSRLILPCPFRPYPDELTDRYRFWAVDTNNSTAMTFGSFIHVTLAGTAFLRNPGGIYNLTTGYYTVPISGYYIIAVANNTVFMTARARINNTTVLPQFTTPAEVGIGLQDRVLLKKGDVVDLVVNSSDTTAGFQMLYLRPDINDFDEGTGIKFEEYGNPDWNAADLILGITHAFGLIWDTDYALQTVRVEPRDRYTLRSRDPNTEYQEEGFYKSVDRRDISALLDVSKEAELFNLAETKRDYEMAWRGDGSDANTESADENALLPMYDGRYTLPEDRYAEGKTRLENQFFAKTMHVLDSAIVATGSAVSPLLPLMQAELYGQTNDERGDFDPRILYFAGRRSGLDGLVKMQNVVGSGTFNYDFPAAWMVPYNDSTGYDPALSFGDATRRDGNVTPGLMQVFHFQHIARLANGKRFAAYVQWSAVDILGIDFRQKLLINGTLFLLEQIENYKPLSGGSTETTLLADAVFEDSETVESSDVQGYLPKQL